MNNQDWTIFGYYGGETHRNKGGEMWQTWYTVNDFGDLVPSFYPMLGNE